MMDWLLSYERFFGRLAAGDDRQEQITDALTRPEFIHRGKWPLLFLLFGLLLAFILVRINTRLIRSGVKWWPGNIEHGDLHIHHVVFGFAAMVIAGIVEFAVQPTGWTQYIVAFIFGGAMGIALDEFALILHLKDVYWQEAGRQSIDAVVIAIVFICMFLVGLAPLSINNDAVTASRWSLFGYIAVHSVFVVITLLKGKIWSGIVGIFIPIFAWVGAFRLARPNSPWAHSRYLDKPRKMERARRRVETNDRRWGRLRLKLFDFIGGKPSVPTAADQPAGAVADANGGAAAGGSGAGAPPPAGAPADQPAGDWDWRDYD
jgi:lysyl-tRNA synthetase class 2